MTTPPRPGEQDRGSPSPLWATLVATWFWAGYSPWASGTVGTAAGLLIVLIPGATEPVPLGMLILAGFLAGALASRRVASHVGHRLTRSAELAKERFQPGDHAVPDPSIVVIDEVVGIWIALLFLPPSLPSYLCAFLAFRVFDILKPPPARQLENVPRGWGIMLDDVVAGVYANVVSQTIVRFALPSLIHLRGSMPWW